ncbi:MAG: phage holin family protein [Opitutus sp.]|nr:phage holin family protein [Opitutus sp.]
MDTETRSTSSPGLLASLRSVGDLLVGSLHDRFELFSLELHEEKHRVLQSLIWLAAAAFCGALALILASFTIVVLFWDTARVAALLSLTGLYAVAAVVLAVRFRRFRAAQPKPFEATIAELKQDRTCIRNGN